jgi:ATP-dependent DNA ligase
VSDLDGDLGDWPFKPFRTPMEAKVRTTYPKQLEGWSYEPKWDGFRALGWSRPIRLDSRNLRPLLRYFPELDPTLEALPRGTVVDGEVVVVRGDRLDFDALQNRVHPASSRVNKLAAEIPASLVAFDLLARDGLDLRRRPFAERRALLEELMAEISGRPGAERWHLTPSTTDQETGKRWFKEFEAAGCDGIIVKERSAPYAEGRREMLKIKHRRSVDAVVGGYRVHKDGGKLGSLLLGLYTDAGQLHFIGHCSGFKDHDRVELLRRFEALRTDESFGQDARRPGGQSRWSAGKDLSFETTEPVVVQISYDQLTGARFRHATRFERWRPDKDPQECTLSQLERPQGPGFAAVVAVE